MLTIIKQRPEKRGSLRTFEITQVINGQRQHITMLARSTREVSANLLAHAHATARSSA